MRYGWKSFNADSFYLFQNTYQFKVHVAGRNHHQPVVLSVFGEVEVVGVVVGVGVYVGVATMDDVSTTISDVSVISATLVVGTTVDEGLTDGSSSVVKH